MPLSLLSSVEVGEVTEAWLEACLLTLLPSTPAGGCSVEQGEVLLLARLEEGEILCGERETGHGRGATLRCGGGSLGKNPLGALSEHVAGRRTSSTAAGGHLSFHYRSVDPALKVTGVAGGDPSCLGVRAGSRDAGYFEAGRTCKLHRGRTRMGLKPTTFSKCSK